MTHPSHREQVQQFEAKRSHLKKALCDEDDALDALIEAANQKRELEQPTYQEDKEMR
jgi:hypothetical protein